MKKQIFWLMLFCLLFGINLTGIAWAHENDYTKQFIGHMVLCIAMGSLAIVAKNIIFEKLENMVEIEPEEGDK